MGIIDDNYQEKVEIIENEFFENFKKGKNRKEIIEKYHKKLEIARSHFEKQYNKKLVKDKILAGKLKKKKEKPEKYSHLKVTPFDFEFNSWDKFKMGIKVSSFNHSRFWKRNLADKIPAWLLYGIYKIKISIKHFWREMVRIKDNAWAHFKHWIIKLAHDVWKKWVNFYHLSIKYMKRGMSKIAFWKKKKEGEEKEEGEGENKDDEKTEGENKEEDKPKEES